LRTSAKEIINTKLQIPNYLELEILNFEFLFVVSEQKDGEEGGEDVKSARPLYPGLHTHYNGEKQ